MISISASGPDTVQYGSRILFLNPVPDPVQYGIRRSNLDDRPRPAVQYESLLSHLNSMPRHCAVWMSAK